MLNIISLWFNKWRPAINSEKTLLKLYILENTMDSRATIYSISI